MPIGSAGLTAGLYRLTIYKHRTVAPERQWVNSYELEYITDTEFNELLLDVFDFVGFERALHLTSVTIDRAVVSTYAADTTPYEANEFLSIPVNLAGTRLSVGGLGEALPLELVAFVRKAVASGRYGKLHFRGCLMEGEVSAPAGTATFSTTHFSERFTGALTNVAKYMFAANSPSYRARLVMAHRTAGGGLVLRGVEALQLVSPRVRSRTARWYNRSTSQ